MIEILSGLPYNRSFAGIGRMNRRQINVMLRHRDQGGNLEWDLLKAAQRLRQQEGDAPEPDQLEYLRGIRRDQGWPEHLIDKMLRAIKQMRSDDDGPGARQHESPGGDDRGAEGSASRGPSTPAVDT